MDYSLYFFPGGSIITDYGLLIKSGGTFTFTFSHLADAFIQSDLQLGST